MDLMLSLSRHFFRQGAFRFGIPALCLVLSSCTPRPEAPLNVASLVWPGYESLYLARSLGYYDHSGIRLVEMTSAANVSHSLRIGTVDAAAITLDEALTLMQDGVDLRVILVMDISHGGDVLMARPGITNLRALRGKRIGLENAGNGALMLDAVLQAGGLRAADIQQVPMRLGEQVAAYKAGKVDALVTFEPALGQLLQQGARILFDSTQIPDRILDVLVVRGAAIPAHRQTLKTLLAGHFKALDYLANHPGDASARMAPRLAVAPAAVLPQFSKIRLPDIPANNSFLGGATPRLQNTAALLAELMLQHHLLQHTVDVSQLADASLLPQAGP